MDTLAASTASAWPSMTPSGEVLEAADAAGGDDRHADRVRHGAREREVESVAVPSRSMLGEQDLPRPRGLHAPRH